MSISMNFMNLLKFLIIPLYKHFPRLSDSVVPPITFGGPQKKSAAQISNFLMFDTLPSSYQLAV